MCSAKRTIRPAKARSPFRRNRSRIALAYCSAPRILNRFDVRARGPPAMISEYIKQDTSNLDLLGFQYLEFLGMLDASLRPSSYFEIGTSEGNSLARFTCDALCIDPQFRIEAAPPLNRRRTFFLQMTSDEFFRTYGVRNYFPAGPDICFLDGLLRFEFLLPAFI